jgi:hypothetical protein
MSKTPESELSWVGRRLAREVPDAWRSPPPDLRRRVVASLESCARQWPRAIAEEGRLRGFAWGGGLAAVVGLGAWLVVRVVTPQNGGAVNPTAVVLDLDVERSIDHVLARWEEPLRGEARLLVEDARGLHAYFAARVPRPVLPPERSD